MQTATTTGILAKIETITGLETETNAGTGPRTEPEIGTAPGNGLDLAHRADNHQRHSNDRSGLSPHRTTHSKARMVMEARVHQP